VSSGWGAVDEKPGWQKGPGLEGRGQGGDRPELGPLLPVKFVFGRKNCIPGPDRLLLTAVPAPASHFGAERVVVMEFRRLVPA